MIGWGTGLVALLAGLAAWCAVGVAWRPRRPAARPERTVESRRAARERRAREAADLPHLVGLVAVGVSAGAPVPDAVVQACEAFGGSAAGRLQAAAVAVEWGADPTTTWSALADDDTLAPLGRALARSSRTGASVVRTLALLADDLAEEGRARREDAARSVGVKAAVPLGVCLLPAFLLLGIVPLVAGMASSLLAG